MTGGLAARHLILIGLPGAGKSTAGRLLAQRLGTHCTDVDPIIERATGLSIADLFAEEGEPAFRDREHLAVVQALGLPPHVVAPGGGWAAHPGNLDETAAAFLIHLAITPEAAAARLAGDRSRPLLRAGVTGRWGSGSEKAGGSVMAGLPGGVAPNRPNAASETRARLTALAALRAPFYRRAGAEVEVTGRPATEVADLLLEVARKQAGWP